MVLNETQKLRLYMVFRFEEGEHITKAELFDDGRMEIEYVDTKTKKTGVAKPYFFDDDMKAKLDFILNGLTLERTE